MLHEVGKKEEKEEKGEDIGDDFCFFYSDDARPCSDEGSGSGPSGGLQKKVCIHSRTSSIH